MRRTRIPDANTINFAAGVGGTITTALTPSGLAVTSPVTINGPGARKLTIKRIFGRPRLLGGITGVRISGLTVARRHSSTVKTERVFSSRAVAI